MRELPATTTTAATNGSKWFVNNNNRLPGNDNVKVANN